MKAQQVNVLLLGAAFHLLFFSFQTSVFIQQTVVNSIRLKPGHEFTGDGYTSLCLTYAVFALANWLAPSLVALTGAKWAMFLGALTYVAYSASFIQPTTTLFYLAAGLIGLGAGLLWTAQGACLAANSDASTASRNAAIFWSMLQSSILFGNLFVYFAFDSQAATISDRTRHLVYGVLTLVGGLGALTLLLLREPKPSPPSASDGRAQAQEGRQGAWAQFLAALKLARTRDMLLLSTAFLFTGQLLSFFTGVYGTAIGATSQFGPHAKRFIGLAGIFIGVGEILGGAAFGLLGARLHKRLGRDTIFLFGFLVLLLALALTFVNLPPDSPLTSRAIQAPIIEPRLWIALLASVLIGLADACFNTQVYSLLMSVYQSNSVGAFALFKFVQSGGSALAFLYSTRLNLYHQLLILTVISTIATLCFLLIEWTSRRARPPTSALAARRPIEKTESQQNIIAGDSLAQPTLTRPPSASGSHLDDDSSAIAATRPGPNGATAISPLQYIRNMLAAGDGGRKSARLSPRQVV